MFINNLQFWLSSVLFLLINIDQETILDFLNIDGPFNNEEYSYLAGASENWVRHWNLTPCVTLKPASSRNRRFPVITASTFIFKAS